MQIGIDSFGPDNCENPNGYPSVFSSVSGNLDWIRGVMNGHISGNSYVDDQNYESGTTSTTNHHGHTTPKPLHRPSHKPSSQNPNEGGYYGYLGK